EKTLEKLKEVLKVKVKVLRNRDILEVDQENIVPGDIVIIEEGDVVPADLRIFELENLKIDESVLTGESMPVEKSIQVLPEETSLTDRKNIGFMGTYVVEGKGRGIVFATGLNTYLGSIYEKFQKIESFAPHFQRLSRDLILRMILIALTTSSLIFYFAFKRDYPWSDTLLFVLSSAISSIPEGLPIIISVLLVVSAYFLSRQKVLVKNLQATENLSIINLLLSDKTGTLTENSMTARKIFVNDREIEITGEGQELKGNFLVKNENGEKMEINIFEDYPLVKLLNICAIVSEGEIIKDGTIKFHGNARDVALLVLLEKSGLKREAILEIEKIIKREPFSRIKKHKKVIVKHERIESYYIGAFEKIVENAKFVLKQDGIVDFVDKEHVLERGLEYATNGFSVLGVAFNEGEKEENMVFVGLVALYDPPKSQVKETISKLKSAGVDIRILTGDHKATALYIAKEVGFDNLSALDQKEIDSLSTDELKARLKETYIFARINPETKLKILELYQKLGYSVAYIGDGVNDVLGLKRAEVGICMGKRGSEIAKAASDLILIDDNLDGLVQSFTEGRKIFNNLRRTVFFLITTNVAEGLTILTSLILGFPFILKPTHILFLNFVTDTLVGTTLAFEKSHGKEIQNKPRDPKESLITLDLIPFLLIMASSMTILSVTLFAAEYQLNLDRARTYAFLIMSFTQIYNALNLRSLNESLFRISFKYNPLIIAGSLISISVQSLVVFNPTLSNIMGFSQISWEDFLLIFLISSLVLIVGEIYKFFKRKF
ncbi:MAG: cation-transporting P-type ATPase, partial [Patescibacteria group bacterium]|nr:cation-transporting P-type ATPase [Patescibacteria group bacterium]